MTLNGKVAVVTGASRGIGKGIAGVFAQAGANVVLAARTEDALDEVAATLPTRSLVVPTDVSDADAVARLIDRTVAEFGRLDVAVNNAAGGGHPPTPLVDVDLDDFDAAYAANLRAVFVGMKHEIAAMLDSGGGAILNVSSTAGLQGVGGLAAYVSTKYGIEGLTRVAALDYGSAGIRVNSIAPGPILTENLARAGQEAQDAAARAMPVQRVGQPDEVAAAAVWLCSDDAAFITGTTIVIDGGKLAGMPPFAISKPGDPLWRRAG